MLHPTLLAELLDDEIRVARGRLGDRAPSLGHDGRYVRCLVPSRDDTPVWLRLDGKGYDAEPFGLDVCDAGDMPVELHRWPGTLGYAIHPVHQRPFACIQGVAEYFTYPGHHQERWDAYRTRLRLAELLDHLLKKAGRP